MKACTSFRKSIIFANNSWLQFFKFSANIYAIAIEGMQMRKTQGHGCV